MILEVFMLVILDVGKEAYTVDLPGPIMQLMYLICSSNLNKREL